MISFGGYGTVLSILNLVIWDRSDIIFLRRLDGDPSHLTYFAVALNLNDRVLNLLRTFTNAAGVSITAQYGRNQKDVPAMTAISMRYGLLLAAPALAGMAVVGGLLATVMYGPAYTPVAVPLLITALFSIFKPLLLPLLSLLQAFERQRLIVAWGCMWAVVNVAMDVALIPHLGASGAAAASGVAQTGMVVGLWWSARREYRIDLASSDVLRILAAGVVCGICAAAARLLPVPAGVQISVAVAAGFCGFLVAARSLRLVRPEDRTRLNELVKRLPGPVSTWVNGALQLLVPASKTV
jgi:O-antigen/teichoic acid export membrane protein